MRCCFFCFTKSRLDLCFGSLASLGGPGIETTCKKCVGDIKNVKMTSKKNRSHQIEVTYQKNLALPYCSLTFVLKLVLMISGTNRYV